MMLAGTLMELRRFRDAELPAEEAVELGKALRTAGNTDVEPLIRAGLAQLAACRLDDSSIDEAINPAELRRHD